MTKTSIFPEGKIIKALKEVYYGQDVKKVAKKYKVHFMTIYEWCKKAKVTRRDGKVGTYNWDYIHSQVVK